MRKRQPYLEMTIFADFETTVENDTKQQKTTEVWSAAWAVEGSPDDYKHVHVDHSIDDFFKSLESLNYNVKCYFHNLKFDGSYILTYLFEHGYEQMFDEDGNKLTKSMFGLKPKQFTYVISDKGTWYTITVRLSNKHFVRFWDSLKIAPSSLKSLADGFKTKHRKLEMDYKGNHYAGCNIKNNEMKYIKNDILAMKEVLEMFHAQHLNALTIGSECMKEYTTIMGGEDSMKILFPDLTAEYMPDVTGVTPVWQGAEKYDTERTYDAFIRRSYHGGFCYCSPKFAGKRLNFVSHADANSHYPSMMHSKSGNYYPICEPSYLDAKTFKIIENINPSQGYYFVRFQCAFMLKPDKIPMVQIKDDYRFVQQRNEWLTSSNGYVVDMVMTMTDYKQFKDSYDTKNFKVIEAVLFPETTKGLFDDYIDKWMQVKMTSKGAPRQIAKLFLNNLYGQFSKSRCSDYKVCDYVAGKGLKYRPVIYDNSKKPGYIAIGSAITSYARHFTEMIAQNNIDDFVYADTDSVVMTLPENQIVGLPIDPVKLCYWKVESNSDDAVFVRQKTYIEHVTHEDGQPIAEPYYNVKCAGMGKGAKSNVIKALKDNYRGDLQVYYEDEDGNKVLEEGDFSLDDFHEGLVVAGNLKPRNIDGGVLLTDMLYQMR